jgi:beta-phosphoglucomutase
MIKAVLMDLDGTLCDCTELHYVSFNKSLHEVSGYTISRVDHESTFNGLPTKKKIDLLINDGKIDPIDKQKIWDLKQQYTKETVSETLKPDQDKIAMLQWLRNNGIKTACVTNSIAETGSLILQVTGQWELMDLFISNDMIKFPKPHAEGYIRAMIHFQTMPENVLVVEDSDVGMASANASGAHVWRIKDSYELTLENMMLQIGER